MAKGYAACKDCKPDRDAKYIVSEEISEFEKILHNEFGFGKDYIDKVLKLLSNLYEGINTKKKNNYDSNKEYHKLLASVVYQNRKTWSLIAGHYSSKDEVIRKLNKNYNSLKINDKSYFDDKSISNLYDEVISQHDIKSGNDNDFAHMSAIISVYAHQSIFKSLAGNYAKKYNGIDSIEAQSGFIGDICGTNGTKPSMSQDDYAADLDAVNLHYRYKNNKKKSLYVIFIEYYNELRIKSTNRSKEFLFNIGIDVLNEYRDKYSKFLKKDSRFKYDENSSDYINRMNYFDNFLYHIINNEQNFVRCKYFQYSEY